MNQFEQKSRLKIYLSIIGVFIILISLFYTNYLANLLEKEEKKKVELFLHAFKYLSDTSTKDLDYTLALEIVENSTIPMIIENSRGTIDGAKNFGEKNDKDQAFLKKELLKLKASGVKPITAKEASFTTYVWYKNSLLITLLKYFPFFQFFLIGGFIILGYIGFNAAKKAEQNQVWVGMAKETAHQMGTPISAILAWLEHLKLTTLDEEQKDILHELKLDVDRLDLVADRFSKIGSPPKLEANNIYERLDDIKTYMEKRSPKKVNFDFPLASKKPLFIPINKHLFDWVFENLIRNALDAMKGKGIMKAKIIEENDRIIIEFSDTGHGIPPTKLKTIFEPGFTTKKRGWGLGLSLSKRIIESYHAGKIYVKNSNENEGTTFAIEIPKEKKKG